jgi:hypothetical protein
MNFDQYESHWRERAIVGISYLNFLLVSQAAFHGFRPKDSLMLLQ